MNYHSNTNYQTSFRIEDPEGLNFEAVQEILYEWLTTKEKDRVVISGRRMFLYRCAWDNLFRTRASISTETYLSQEGNAWALNYTHADRDLGARRFWYTDVGLRQFQGEIVVSIRISYAWHREDLNTDPIPPEPSVPYFVRRILDNLPVFSGRKDFKLIQKPIVFHEVGQGKLLVDFIQSPERRYPLIVVNGDTDLLKREANQLATQLAGKCQVAVIADNPDLAAEVREFLHRDYRVDYGRLRVFFPFSTRQNSLTRHRWFKVDSPDYDDQRAGILNGLLRNNALQEPGSVETITQVKQLIVRAKLTLARESSGENSAQLDEFYGLFQEVEKERDDYKAQAEAFAAEVDAQEELARQYRFKAEQLEAALDSMQEANSPVGFDVPSSLPSTLAEVVSLAMKCFPRIVFTEQAVRSSSKADDCDCVAEAWEMIWQMSEILHPLKFNADGPQDLEKLFGEKSRYELGMSEGRNTKRDASLMALRKVEHEGKSYDITPHIKHGNRAPKMVRIHFAFDDDAKKLVVGFVGSHLENATSRKMK
jgi:hypothetical protein